MAEGTTAPGEGRFAAAEAAPPDPILLVTPAWSREGGIAAHVLTSAAALAAAGARVEVVVASIETSERPPGVTLHEEPRLLETGVPAEQRLGPAARLRPAVAHLHQVEDLELIACLRERAPVVLSAHGYLACTADEYYFRPGQECTRPHGPMCVPNMLLRGCAHTFDPRPLPGAYRRTTRQVAALRVADLAISYSSAVDRHLAANAIEPRRIVPLFGTLAPAPAAPEGRRVLFVGRVVPAKGLATLIRAARQVPDCEFVVCGDGWQLQPMRRLAARLGVTDRFEFRGWLAPQQLAAELAAATLVAIPSIWPEPFGLVGLEALAASRPVVASGTGGIPDWLRDGVSGLLCPPGDAAALAGAIKELLGDPERRLRMGQAGCRDVAERFTAERHTDSLLGAYAEAAQRWRAGRVPAVSA